MFLCGTSKPAHMQIAIYIQYRRGEHANWAHRKHQNTKAHTHWLQKCCSRFCTVLYQCQMCYTYKHPLYCLGFIPVFMISETPIRGQRL